MKIEMNEDAALAITITSIFLSLFILIGYWHHQDVVTNREAIKAGLEQQEETGGVGLKWVKPK